MKHLLIIFVFVLCLFSADRLSAQTGSNEGTEFYVTFLKNGGPIACQVRYVVTTACSITAQYGDGTYLDNNAYYPPGVYTRNADIGKSVYNATISGVSNKMIKITATKNIAVFAINMEEENSDATVILPVTALGNHYTILSHGGIAVSYIAIIAPMPGTTFTIRQPNGSAPVSNQSITAYNQPYFFATAADLTGYTVESNYSVAVFSGIINGYPIHSGGYSMSYEQMLFTKTAGKNYLVWAMSGTPDRIKVVSLEPNTVITKRAGAATSTISLVAAQSAGTFDVVGTPTPYANNSASPVWLSSDKPFIVEHILGGVPSCIEWIAPVEQRVTNAVVSPFIQVAGLFFNGHRLHVMIPATATGNMAVTETRGGVITNPTLTFYTNTSNPDYVIAYKDYTTYDNVQIELSNPAGFIAYMTGLGNYDSYIYAAGIGPFNLENYFTVTTKTTPYDDTRYTETTDLTHTFEITDNITIKRTVEKPFMQVRWLVDGTPYSVSENFNTSHTVTIPTSAFGGVSGSHSISMSVRYNGATADSVYTGTVWLNCPLEICAGKNVTFTATPNNGGTPSYQWYVNNAPVGGATATTYSYVPNNNDKVAVRMTSNAPCVTASTVMSPTITLVTKGPATITTPTQPSAVCSGSTLSLTVPSISLGNLTQIGAGSWTLNGDYFNPTDTVTAAQNGQPLAYKINTDCGIFTSNTVAIEVTPVVVPSLTITAVPD